MLETASAPTQHAAIVISGESRNFVTYLRPSLRFENSAQIGNNGGFLPFPARAFATFRYFSKDRLEWRISAVPGPGFYYFSPIW
jgi:hypothetical protein